MGRSPAVEPVSGLSIDKYQEGKGTKVKDPNKAGYDWNKTDASQPLGFQDDTLLDNQANNEMSFYVLIASLSVLPLMIFFLYRRRETTTTMERPDNVVELPKRHDSDHDDISKAS